MGGGGKTGRGQRAVAQPGDAEVDRWSASVLGAGELAFREWEELLRHDFLSVRFPGGRRRGANGPNRPGGLCLF